MQEIGERLPATIELALFSVLIASVLGVSLGVICAVKQNSALDRHLSGGRPGGRVFAQVLAGPYVDYPVRGEFGLAAGVRPV